MLCCSQKQAEEVNEPIQNDNMFNVANVKVGEMLSACSGDTRQDVLQRKFNILSFSSNDKSSFEEDQADVVAKRLLSNL